MEQHLIRVGSLPAPVQKAVQALVSAHLAHVGKSPVLAHLPADLMQAGLHLESEAGLEHSTNYKVGLLLFEDQPDGRTLEMQATILLTLPDDAHISVAPATSSQTKANLDQAVTLSLKHSTLEEALRTLDAQTPLNLVGIGPGPFARRADVALTAVPLHAALDSLAQTYGYRWEQQDNGILRLWVEPEAYQEAITRAGKTLMQQYDRLPADIQDGLTAGGVPMKSLPARMQEAVRRIAETPKPATMLTAEELTARSQAPDLAKSSVRIHIAPSPHAPWIHVRIGSDAMGWKVVRFLEPE